MPLAPEGWSGERAADGVSLPRIARIRRGLHKIGLLLVGDGKRRALATRAYRARPQDGYVAPLPLTGAPAEAMDAWGTAGVTPGEAGAFGRIGRTNDHGHEVLAAEG